MQSFTRNEMLWSSNLLDAMVVTAPDWTCYLLGVYAVVFGDCSVVIELKIIFCRHSPPYYAFPPSDGHFTDLISFFSLVISLLYGRMPFAQLVIGPPGAGKSTYCNDMHQFLGAIGRKCSIVNLDPANDQTSYPCALDVRDLVTLEEIMGEDKLGPNGGVLYALEELEQNFEFLEEGLKELGGRHSAIQDMAEGWS